MTTAKTAIVTGASSGIGLGVTIALTASPDLALLEGDIAYPETARNIVKQPCEED
jgi:NAD(P)-dependent dehydrogenase (short-subunit alcohol dehydrogenase family)